MTEALKELRQIKGILGKIETAVTSAVSSSQLDQQKDLFGVGGDIMDNLNSGSLTVETGCMLEPSLANVSAGTVVQFERKGYFAVDRDSTPGAPVFNRTVTLRDMWAKIAKKQE